MKNAVLNRFLAGLRSERGDHVTVLILSSMILLILALGVAIDTNKNATTRADYYSISQEATQAAVRAQDGAGNLQCGGTDPTTLKGLTAMKNFVNNPDEPAAKRLAVKTYLEKTGRMAATTSALSSDSNFNVNMRRYGGDNAAFDEDPSYFSMTIQCRRGISNAVGNGTNTNNSSTVGNGSKINVIEFHTSDWCNNFILSMFGQTVQKYNIDTRAISSWSGSAVGE